MQPARSVSRRLGSNWPSLGAFGWAAYGHTVITYSRSHCPCSSAAQQSHCHLPRMASSSGKRGGAVQPAGPMASSSGKGGGAVQPAGSRALKVAVYNIGFAVSQWLGKNDRKWKDLLRSDLRALEEEGAAIIMMQELGQAEYPIPTDQWEAFILQTLPRWRNFRVGNYVTLADTAVVEDLRMERLGQLEDANQRWRYSQVGQATIKGDAEQLAQRVGLANIHIVSSSGARSATFSRKSKIMQNLWADLAVRDAEERTGGAAQPAKVWIVGGDCNLSAAEMTVAMQTGNRANDDFFVEPRPGTGGVIQVMCSNPAVTIRKYVPDVGRYSDRALKRKEGHASDAHTAVGVELLLPLLPRRKGGAEQPARPPLPPGAPPQKSAPQHALPPQRLEAQIPPMPQRPVPRPTAPEVALQPQLVAPALVLAPPAPKPAAPEVPAPAAPQEAQAPKPPAPKPPAPEVPAPAPEPPAVRATAAPQEAPAPEAPEQAQAPEPALQEAPAPEIGGGAAQPAPLLPLVASAAEVVERGLGLVITALDARDMEAEGEEPRWAEDEEEEEVVMPPSKIPRTTGEEFSPSQAEPAQPSEAAPSGPQPGVQEQFPVPGVQEQAQLGGVAQPAEPLAEDELDWMLRFFCAAKRMENGALRPHSKEHLAEKVAHLLRLRREFLWMRELPADARLSIKDVSQILNIWRSRFEETPAQLELKARDWRHLDSTGRLHRCRSRFEQELRMGYYSPNLVKIVLGVGLADPRLWRRAEALASASGAAQPAGPFRLPAQAALVKEAQLARNLMRRGQRVSEAAFNLAGACGHCGYTDEALVQCDFCGVLGCSWCMCGQDMVERTVCWRCPSFDRPGGQQPPSCERCHGLGFPVAEVREELRGEGMELETRPFGPQCGAEWKQEVLRSLPAWCAPVKQCRHCGMKLCKGCAHSEVRECKGDCATLRDAKRRKLRPETVQHLFWLAESWRRRDLEQHAWTLTQQADEVALHPHVGTSLAKRVLHD